MELTGYKVFPYCNGCKNNCFKGKTVNRQLFSGDINSVLNYKWSQEFPK